MDKLKSWQFFAAFVLLAALALWGAQQIRAAGTPPFRGTCADYAHSDRSAIRVELRDCAVNALDIAQYGVETGGALEGDDYYAALTVQGSDARVSLLLKLGPTDIALYKQIAAIAGSDRADMESALAPLVHRLDAPRVVSGYADPGDDGPEDKAFRASVTQYFDGTQNRTRLAPDWRVLNPDWTAGKQRDTGIAACVPLGALCVAVGWHLIRRRQPVAARPANPSGFVRVDIRTAARAARHLYVWSSVAIYLMALGTVAGASVVAMQAYEGTVPFASIAEAVLLSAVLGAVIVVTVRARLRLSWPGYLATGVVLVGVPASGVPIAAEAWDKAPRLQEIAPSTMFAGAVMSLIVAAAVFALYAWSTLAFARYAALSAGPFGVAAAVSRLIAGTRTLAPSAIHAPRNPAMTIVFAVLFVLSLPVAVAVSLLIPIVGWMLPVFAAAMARRYYTYDAKVLLSLDRRAPVLYLRSFGDDKARTWGKGFFGKLRGRTLDEAIAPFARLLGPYIAIANPAEKLPHIGAAQSYFTDETWQDAIAQWVSMAQLIVMQAGRTEGIAWELSHIFGAGRHSRLVVLIPPAMRRNPAAVTGWLAEHFMATPCAGLIGSVDPVRTIALVFHDAGLVAIESPEIRNAEIDYLVAFQHAAFVEFCWPQTAAAAAAT